MIASGELFLLNGESGGELQPLPGFVNQNIRVIAAKFDRAYVACEPAYSTDSITGRCTVWCFKGDSPDDSPNPCICPEFDVIEESIRQIAIGEKHLLVLTHEGNVYSKGEAIYGNAGHGGAAHSPEFKQIPALKGKRVKLVAAGPYFSIAVTHEGDVYSWGQSFNGETGLFTQVDAVPRFAPVITPYRVTSISCGHSHVLACTESQQCISWGENTCGQLGVGHKTKPTFKPQLLDSIPSQVAVVSAGWAHSVAVGVDGRTYTWGLNSHGQLGLGDTKTRLAPNLLHALVSTTHVQTAHASRAMSIFYTSDSKALLCGMVPCSPKASDIAVEFAPRRSGQVKAEVLNKVKDTVREKWAPTAADEFGKRGYMTQEEVDGLVPPVDKGPSGCLLCPVPLVLASGVVLGSSPSVLTEIAAFDRGAVGFARSTVYKVAPNLAPVTGDTNVQVHVTGLPFEVATRAHIERGLPLVQDLIPVKVRLKSAAPLCDVVVAGKIVAEDTVEFTTPNVTLSPLGSVVEQGKTSAVQLQVSIDNGLTWTVERVPPPQPAELDKTSRLAAEETLARPPKRSSMQEGLRTMKQDFAINQKLAQAVSAAQTVLWYCRWPSKGPTHLEPNCAPVAGGTELLIHVQLPPLMPTDSLTVRFLCKSLPAGSVGDPEEEAKAPMQHDASQMINCMKETNAAFLKAIERKRKESKEEEPYEGFNDEMDKALRKASQDAANRVEEQKNLLPLVGDTDILACGWLDPTGRGVRCITPPFNEKLVKYYEYFVELSLDGRRFLGNALPYNIFNLQVIALEPNLGPLTKKTKVTFKTTGLVQTEIQQVRIDFPRNSGYEPKTLSADYDARTHEVTFDMPDLSDYVRQNVELLEKVAQAEAAAAARAAEGREEGAEGDGGGDAPLPAAPPVPVDGGLSGLEVFAELSLNGQNFTQNRIHFTYHGPVQAGGMRLIAAPEGVSTEAAPADPKKKPAKGAPEEPVEEKWHLGSKIGCDFWGAPADISSLKFACVRFRLMTRVGDEEPVPYKVPLSADRFVDDEGVDRTSKRQAEVEYLPATVEPAEPSAEEEESPSSETRKKNTIVAMLETRVRKANLPDDAVLIMQDFEVSLNGQAFVPCEGTPVLRLEPIDDREAS